MAWDDVGHKITAYVAWQRMTPQARDAVIDILRQAPEDSDIATYYLTNGSAPLDVRRQEYFELIATWADIVRDYGFEPPYKKIFEARQRKYHKANWHYSDTFWKQIDGRVELLPPPDEGGRAVERLIAFDKLTRDAASTPQEKAVAIAWMMHLTGDLHQPLHTSARVTDLEPKGDQGGNLFQLTPKGTPRADQVNLHWYWDSIVGRNVQPKKDMSDGQYIKWLGDAMMKRYPYARAQGQIELGDYESWKKESFALATSEVFRSDLIRFEMPSMKYRKNAYRVAERQLALAGYRLGETMNAIFGTAAAVPAARPAS